MSASIGLETHIQNIMSVIGENGLRDIVLVGHSYGGMVITGVVDRMKDRIRHIVYLDAAVPDDGQSMISYGPRLDAAKLAEKSILLRALSSDGVALDTLPPEAFGVPPSHPRYGWVKARLTPHPMKTWLDPLAIRNAGAAGVRRSYIHCVAPVLPQTNFPYLAAKAKASASWRYAELQTGHDAMITAPRDLAKLLLSAQ